VCGTTGTSSALSASYAVCQSMQYDLGCPRGRGGGALGPGRQPPLVASHRPLACLRILIPTNPALPLLPGRQGTTSLPVRAPGCWWR